VTNSLGSVNRHRTTVPGFAQSLLGERPAARLESGKRNRVLGGRNQEREREAANCDESAEVEQRHPTQAAEVDVRIVAHGDSANCQQDSKFGGTDAAKRHLEHASDGRRQKDFAGDKQIRDEQRQRDNR